MVSRIYDGVRVLGKECGGVKSVRLRGTCFSCGSCERLETSGVSVAIIWSDGRREDIRSATPGQLAWLADWLSEGIRRHRKEGELMRLKETPNATLYGVREGNGMSFYLDREMRIFVGHDPYRYYRKDQTIMLNGWKHEMIVIRKA